VKRLKRSIRRKILNPTSDSSNIIDSSQEHPEAAIEIASSKSPGKRHAYRRWKVPIETHREWLTQVGEKLGVKQLQDWYRVKPNDVIEDDLGALIRAEYHWSLSEALVKIYPEHEWHEWRFNKTPNGFWASPTNRRRFFEWLQSQLGLRTMEDWYGVQKVQIARNGGNGLLTHYYNQSAARAIMEAFPEHKWQPWKFKRVPMGFWNEIAHRKLFFDHLAELRGFSSMEDWYKLDIEDFVESGGSSIAVAFNNRIPDIVMQTFPEHEWKPWMFRRSMGLRRQEDHRAFMDWLFKKLGMKDLAEWYHTPSMAIREHGGTFLTLLEPARCILIA
jgi:hypothetical protein